MKPKTFLNTLAVLAAVFLMALGLLTSMGCRSTHPSMPYPSKALPDLSGGAAFFQGLEELGGHRYEK